MSGAGGLDRRAVAAGAAYDLAVVVAVVAAYTGLSATGIATGGAALLVTAVIVVVVAPAVGGTVAARRARASPLTHSAAAAGAAVIAFVAFRMADAVVRGKPLTIGTIVILVMLSVVVGMVAGGIDARVSHR